MTEDAHIGAFHPHVISLRDQLGWVFTYDTIQSWIRAGEGRGDFLGDTIFGTVRWSRELGRPATPSLADGFELKHIAYTLEIEPGTYDKIYKLISVPPLEAWGLEADDYYIVGFASKIIGGFFEAIEVTLANRPWDVIRPYPGTRLIEPSSQSTGLPDGRPVFLEWEVSIVPYFARHVATWPG